MKIIRNAREQPWSYDYDCRKCESALQVERADLTFVADFRDGDAFKFTCPVCREENWIAAKLLPRSLRP